MTVKCCLFFPLHLRPGTRCRGPANSEKNEVLLGIKTELSNISTKKIEVLLGIKTELSNISTKKNWGPAGDQDCAIKDSLQFSPLTEWVVGEVCVGCGGAWRWFDWDPLPVFSAGHHCEQFWHVQGCPVFDIVHPAFSLPTTASPILPEGEAVVACDMPEPCKFPSLESCQKRFSWTHKEVYLAPQPDVGLVLYVTVDWSSNVKNQSIAERYGGRRKENPSTENAELSKGLYFKAFDRSE